MTQVTVLRQIEDWKAELASAMDDQNWRRALRLCSWLRYTLDEQGRSDTGVEQMHNHAKAALAEQVSRERAEQAQQRARHHLRRVTENQVMSGNWSKALDAIEAFHHNGASREETLGLLQAFRDRLSNPLSAHQRPTSTQATALSQRLDKLLEQIRIDA